MDKKISIVMPAYNAEKYLESSVESVLAQTYGNFELLIVNDGSTDGTKAMAEALAERDGRIRVLSRPNGGISAARNDGIAAAAGDVIWFMDSDDTIVPSAAGVIARAFEEYDADILEFGIRYLEEDGTVTGESSPKLAKVLYEGAEVRDFLLAETIATSPVCAVPNGLTVYSCTVAYAAAFLRRLHWRMISEREYIYEDYFTRLQLFGRADRVAVVPDVLYNYYQRPNSVLHRYQSDRFARVRQLYADALQLCGEMGYNENVRKRVAWFFISNVNVAMYAMLRNVTAPSEQRRILRQVLRDELFQKAVGEWKGADFPRSRALLFMAYRSRNPLLLQTMYRYQMKKMSR